MTIEPVTELGSGGVLPSQRARVVPLSAPPAAYTSAVERYLTGGHREVRGADLPDFADDVGVDGRRGAGGDRAGSARCEAPAVPVSVIDDPSLPEVVAELAAARADEMDADTLNRELSSPGRRSAGGSDRAGSPTIRRSASSVA